MRLRRHSQAVACQGSVSVHALCHSFSLKRQLVQTVNGHSMLSLNHRHGKQHGRENVLGPSMSTPTR